jgi:hypothetical protein
MQVVLSPTRCIWCDGMIDSSNSLEVTYQCCSDCLVPLPTE